MAVRGGGTLGHPPTPAGRARTGARLLGVFVALFLGTLVSVPAALGQGAPAGGPPAPEAVARIVTAAEEAGVPVVIIGARLPAAAPAAPAPSRPLAERAAERARELTARLRQDLAELRALPRALPTALARVSGRPTGGWVFGALAIAFAAATAGYLIERALVARLERLMLDAPPGPGSDRAGRLRFVLLRTLIRTAAIGIGIGAGFVAAAVALSDLPGHEAVVLSIFETLVTVRLALLFFRVALAPDEPAMRFFTVDEGVARRTFRRLWIGAAIVAAVSATGFWFQRIGMPAGTINAAVILSSTLGAALLGDAAWRLRLRRAPDAEAAESSWLRRKWHLLAIVYLALAFATTVVGRLAGAEVHGLVVAPVSAAILATVLYALGLLAVDRLFPRHAAAPSFPSFREWAERSALLVAALVAVGLVLGAWGVGLFDPSGRVQPAFTVLIVAAGAWIGWSAIRTGFDIRLAQERGTAGPEREDADEGGPGGTRLATILPLFRNALLIGILVIVIMVGLSSVGVDIAPLFAGAGLVGIAVGFGAQTLVRDIFSGAFFLIDDAFRVGEYIDTGGAKGTVEKISIRSMQLRHHTGPLHTIPFGEIKQLTNFSRDWVIMKLPIRVRFGTDTERVRKLVKKLGQELLDDPVIGAKFVEPLKSQGVYRMDEYGIITRVKFKTRPGDQFAVRKVVYQRIGELFEREGIAFGGREVVVRAADAGGDSSQAALAAAAAADAASVPPAPR